MEFGYEVSALDRDGEFLPDVSGNGGTVRRHAATLTDAFEDAEQILATDDRAGTAWVRRAVRDEPGTAWRPTGTVGVVQRGSHSQTTAQAVARVVDTVAREHFRAHGQDLNLDTQRGYLPIVEGMVCWPDGNSRVLVCTETPGDYPDLHKHIAADALDFAVGVLHGSPYQVPDTAVIGHVRDRLFELTW